MKFGALPPEAHLDLQIGLDRLQKAQDQCRDALTRLLCGSITRAEYLDLLRRQVEAQRHWESRHRKYAIEVRDAHP